MYDEEHGPREPIAWEEFHIHGDDELVTMHWSTNDDEDTGEPGVAASDRYTYKRREGLTAMQQAVRHAGGGSRQGIGHKVTVYINDEEYVGGREYTG